MNKLNLILHCGGSVATREQLEKIPTPDADGRWRPIPHTMLLDIVESELKGLGMNVVNEVYGLAQDGKRMFGIFQIERLKLKKDGTLVKDYSWVAGLRNSHDKSFRAGLCVGSGVFVCDNLAFSSDIEFERRHTTNILRDLPVLVTEACGELASKWDTQGERIKAYKEVELDVRSADHLICMALRQGVFPKIKVTDILAEWDKPKHDEFEPRNVWSMFNCVTEHLKPRFDSKGHSLWDLPSRTNRLHAICDSVCGINFSPN